MRLPETGGGGEVGEILGVRDCVGILVGTSLGIGVDVVSGGDGGLPALANSKAPTGGVVPVKRRVTESLLFQEMERSTVIVCVE